MIPEIDFSKFLDGSTHDRRQIALQVDQALSTLGSFYLFNHGIEQSKIDKCFDWSRVFFSLPEDEKESLSPTYCGVGKEIVRGQSCMKESLHFSDRENYASEVWSKNKQVSNFHDTAAGFFKDCSKLLNDLLDCVSIALSLDPEESLNKYHTGSSFGMDIIHYPAISSRTLDSGETFRKPAHADFGTFTFLFQQDVGGLEVADMSSTHYSSTRAVVREGTFIHADPKPGSILVQTGFLLMRWTNRRWKNTVHRVVAPPAYNERSEDNGAKTSPERYSMAFFGGPDGTAIVEPFKSCCNEENPRTAETIYVGEYLEKKKSELRSDI